MFFRVMNVLFVFFILSPTATADEVMVQIHDPFAKHKLEAVDLIETSESSKFVSGLKHKQAFVDSDGKAYLATIEVVDAEVPEIEVDVLSEVQDMVVKK